MFSNILAHCQYQDVRCLEQHFLFFFLYQKTFLWFFIFLFYIFVVWCRCIMLWELLKEHLRVLCIIFVDMLCFPNIFCHSEVFCLFQRMSLCLSFCFFPSSCLCWLATRCIILKTVINFYDTCLV